MISDSQKNSAVADVIMLLLNLIFTYIKYVVLTPIILIAMVSLFLVLMLAVPMIALIVVGIPLYLLAPLIGELHISEQIQGPTLNAADFLMVYAVISFALMVIVQAAKATMKYVFKKNAELHFRAKVKAVLIFYTVCFVSALMLLLWTTFSGGAKGGIAIYIFVFTVFIVSVISMLFVLYISEHIDKMRQSAISTTERLLQKQT